MKAYKSKVIVVGGRWLARVLLLLSMATFGLRVCARAILVPTQPVSPYADTEVSTNVVIQTGRTDVRDVKIRLQLDGTPTNNLEIAFGCDANTNGVLDVSEIETVYGWRAGRYFVENVRAWERIETEAATNALCGVVDIQLRNDAQTVPRRFTATCGISPERSEPRQRSLEGCVAAFPELATTPPPAWLFREEWNMVRVTRRGAGVPSEWVRCDVKYASFAIKLR